MSWQGFHKRHTFMKVLLFLRISSTMLATKAAILRRSEEDFSKKRQKI